MNSIQILEEIYKQVYECKEPNYLMIGQLRHHFATMGPLSFDQRKLLLTDILSYDGETTSVFLSKLEEFGVLKYIFPEISRLKAIPQDKSGGSVDNAFEHTMRVVKYSPNHLIVLAMFHDTGKYHTYITDGTFKDHALVSALEYYGIMKTYGFTDEQISPDTTCIAYHMEPHDYQRRVKNLWSDSDVLDFIDAHGSVSNAIRTIDLAIADKKASHNVADFLVPYEEMKERCLELIMKDEHQSILLCPACMDAGVLSNVKLYTKDGRHFCKKCGQAYSLVDGNLMPEKALVFTAKAKVERVEE